MFGLRPARGDGSGERNSVCFRFLSDKDIVSHEKVFMSLADYFHFLSATKGVAEVELMNHAMEQKRYPEPPVAVPPQPDCLLLCLFSSFSHSRAQLASYVFPTVFLSVKLQVHSLSVACS